MKKAKLIKTNKKQQEIIEKDSYSLKKLLLIVLILVIIFGIFYFVTTLFINPVNGNNTNNSINEINSTKITLNNILNRNSEEYYVIATKKSDNEKVNYIQLYNNYISEYSSKENAKPFYSVDLSDALNKTYIGEKLNISNDITKIKLNDEVLFKIKNAEIEEYFVGSSEILKKLSNLKES